MSIATICYSVYCFKFDGYPFIKVVDSKRILKLVRSAQSGNTEAFGEIYDILIYKVYRFVFFRVGRREDAEDITEAVFLKAWQALRSYKESGAPFEAWLFRITRNAVIDHWRTRKQTVSIEAFGNIADDHNLPPDEAVGQKMQIAQVHRCLGKIKSSYQEIIVMKFIEEKSNEEISTILQKPEDHIRVLQSRAIRALRKVLEDES